MQLKGRASCSKGKSFATALSAIFVAYAPSHSSFAYPSKNFRNHAVASTAASLSFKTRRGCVSCGGNTPNRSAFTQAIRAGYS